MATLKRKRARESTAEDGDECVCKSLKTDQEKKAEDERDQSVDLADVSDESFFDLLRTVAHMGLADTDPSQPEHCPICSQTMPLREFASHVYQCIKKLDVQDTEQQVRQDERVARALAEVHGFDAAIETHFQPSVECPNGSACRRVDAKHFETMYHPPVACPLCEQEYPVYEVDAHITQCLRGRGTFPDRGADKMDLDTSHGEHKNKTEDMKKVATKSLSFQQLSALSQEILNRTDATHKATEKNKATQDEDISLCDLLDTFKALGLDKDSLKEAVGARAASTATLPGGTTLSVASGDRIPNVPLHHGSSSSSMFADVVLSAQTTNPLSASISASLSELSARVPVSSLAGSIDTCSMCTLIPAEAVVALSVPDDL